LLASCAPATPQSTVRSIDEPMTPLSPHGAPAVQPSTLLGKYVWQSLREVVAARRASQEDSNLAGEADLIQKEDFDTLAANEESLTFLKHLLSDLQDNSLPKTTTTFLAWVGQHFPPPLEVTLDRFARVETINSLLGVLYAYEAESRSIIRAFQSRPPQAHSTMGIVHFCRFLQAEAIDDYATSFQKAKETKDWPKAKACVYSQKEWLPKWQVFIDTYAEKHHWWPLESCTNDATVHFDLQAPFSTVACMQALLQAHTSFASAHFRCDPEKRKTSSGSEEVPEKEKTGSGSEEVDAED
jgi:hypothetical protein